MEEVIESLGFARKNGDGRNADRRLANRRLQPLGHLTADGILSINDNSSYGKPIVARIVPEIVSGAIDPYRS
jgi:hypothetical protein